MLRSGEVEGRRRNAVVVRLGEKRILEGALGRVRGLLVEMKNGREGGGKWKVERRRGEHSDEGGPAGSQRKKSRM
jgi:hypothetical protein